MYTCIVVIVYVCDIYRVETCLKKSGIEEYNLWIIDTSGHPLGDKYSQYEVHYSIYTCVNFPRYLCILDFAFTDISMDSFDLKVFNYILSNPENFTLCNLGSYSMIPRIMSMKGDYIDPTMDILQMCPLGLNFTTTEVPHLGAYMIDKECLSMDTITDHFGCDTHTLTDILNGCGLETVSLSNPLFKVTNHVKSGSVWYLYRILTGCNIQVIEFKNRKIELLDDS